MDKDAVEGCWFGSHGPARVVELCRRKRSLGYLNFVKRIRDIREL